MQEIEEHSIQIYEFPQCDSDEDEDFKQQDTELKVCQILISKLSFNHDSVKYKCEITKHTDNLVSVSLPSEP